MKATTLPSRFGIACLFFLGSVAPVSATLITFDDLSPEYWLDPESSDPDPWGSGDVVPTPLSDQYEHLGVSFGPGSVDGVARGTESNWGAAVSTFADAVVSPSNAVTSFYQYAPDTPGNFSFQFIGDELPDYVSFYVTARPETMNVWVTEEDGDEQTVQLGYEIVDGDITFTEFADRTKIEFWGIDFKSVLLSNPYSHRSTPVYMDDLYFENLTSVAEPGTLPLALSGLLGLGILASRRARHN